MSESNVVLANRKNQLQKLFTAEETNQRFLAYFEGNQSKLEKFKQTIMFMAMDDRMMNIQPMAIFKCALNIAELGLNPQPNMAQVHIVAYKGKPQVTIPYRGWLVLLERSQKLAKCYLVYDCDKYSMEIRGFKEDVNFVPNEEKRLESDSKWVLENLKGGLVFIYDTVLKIESAYYVPRDKLMQLRGMSPAIQKDKFSPWTDFSAEMFKAKAIKYVVSKQPMDERVALAVQNENEFEIDTKEESPQTVAAANVDEDKQARVELLEYFTNKGGIFENNAQKATEYVLEKTNKTINSMSADECYELIAQCDVELKDLEDQKPTKKIEQSEDNYDPNDDEANQGSLYPSPDKNGGL